MSTVESDRQGFQASLQGASLPDLIQMACAGQLRIIYQVRSEGRVGYLYLQDGRVVHAHTRDGVGEEAAYEILAWRSGSVAPCERPWPKVTSIRVSAQGLLMRAAQKADESVRDGRLAPLIPFEEHRRGSDGLGAWMVEEEHEEPPMVPEPFEDESFTDAALVTATGSMRYGKGDDEELAGVVSYVSRLGELVADAMGLDGFEGLDARLGARECAIRRRPDGWAIALGPRGSTSRVGWSP